MSAGDPRARFSRLDRLRSIQMQVTGAVRQLGDLYANGKQDDDDAARDLTNLVMLRRVLVEIDLEVARAELHQKGAGDADPRR